MDHTEKDQNKHYTINIVKVKSVKTLNFTRKERILDELFEGSTEEMNEYRQILKR